MKLLTSRQIRQVRDVCIFRINGMEVFCDEINFFTIQLLYNCTTFLNFATWLEKLSHIRIIIATLWLS